MTTTTTRFATHPLVRAVALAGAPLLMLGSVTAQAQSNTELEELRERIQVLEGHVSTAPELRDDNPYLLREGDGMKIGDTTISFGGFIKADVIFGSNGNGTPNGYSIALPRTLAKAANEGESDWKTGFSVRESRISIGTKTEDVAGHDLTTYIEMDFNTAADAPGNEVVSNSYNARMRQAYGSWNGWDFGQTYTTFTDLAALPEILD